MALKRGIVKLEEYNNNWVNEYEEEKELLLNVIGDKIKEIHHIGSTSIAGVKAKPIIDIMIVLNSFDEIQEIEKILTKYDYSNRGKQGIDDRYFFPKGPDDARTHYIHFTLENSNTYYNQLYFKNYLIKHKEYIEMYNELKEELAVLYKDERSKYTKGKADFIENVIKLAKEEFDNN